MDIKNYMISMVILIGMGILYEKYKIHNEKNNEIDQYDIVKKYLLNDSSLARSNLPIMWIHVSKEINARWWSSFNSRNSKCVNVPYELITIRTIIEKCGEDFNICLIDDDSFKNIIPGWITNLDIVADPVKSKLRELAIANLLNAYGGFFVPSSFLCMKNLIDLYENGTKNDKCLVGEMQSTSINASKKTYTLSPKFLATKKNSPTINAYIEFLQRMVSTDYTNESIFIGETSNWFQDNIKNVNKISAKKLGVANIDGEPIMIEDLVGNSFVSLDDEAYGVYIPTDIVLNRTAYQWLARMSPEQIYNSDTFVGKVSLIA